MCAFGDDEFVGYVLSGRKGISLMEQASVSVL